MVYEKSEKDGLWAVGSGGVQGRILCGFLGGKGGSSILYVRGGFWQTGSFQNDGGEFPGGQQRSLTQLISRKIREQKDKQTFAGDSRETEEEQLEEDLNYKNAYKKHKRQKKNRSGPITQKNKHREIHLDDFNLHSLK